MVENTMTLITAEMNKKVINDVSTEASKPNLQTYYVNI